MVGEPPGHNDLLFGQVDCDIRAQKLALRCSEGLLKIFRGEGDRSRGSHSAIVNYKQEPWIWGRGGMHGPGIRSHWHYSCLEGGVTLFGEGRWTESSAQDSVVQVVATHQTKLANAVPNPHEKRGLDNLAGLHCCHGDPILSEHAQLDSISSTRLHPSCTRCKVHHHRMSVKEVCDIGIE